MSTMSAMIVLKRMIVFFMFFDFAFSIRELVFLYNHREFRFDTVSDKVSDGVCQNIWQVVASACATNIFTIFCFICCISFEKTKEEVDYLRLRLGSVHITAYSMIMYFNINTSCSDFWISNTPNIWMFFETHVMMFLINVIIYVCAAAIMYSEIKSKSNSNKE